MTTFDTDRMARGWGLIAEGAMEISLAYSSIDSAARAADTGAGGAGAESPPRSSAPAEPPSFDELPPEGFVAEVERITGGKVEPALKPQVDAGLGKCPVHGKPWTIKAAGVSKTGKPYEAFYKCAEKDGDAYCTQKPQKIWRDTHPITEGRAAA